MMAELERKEGEQPAWRSFKKVFKCRLLCFSSTPIWKKSRIPDANSISKYERIPVSGQLQSRSAEKNPAGLFCLLCCFIERCSSGRRGRRAPAGSRGANSVRGETRTCAGGSNSMDEIVRRKASPAEGGNRQRIGGGGGVVRPCPSPETPSSLRDSISGLEFERRSELTDEYSNTEGSARRESAEQADPCKQFRNYLVQMIVEDKDLTDLMDVEELLYCYRHLRCPVYRDLLSRFFVELCNDTFSTSPCDQSASGSAEW